MSIEKYRVKGESRALSGSHHCTAAFPPALMRLAISVVSLYAQAKAGELDVLAAAIEIRTGNWPQEPVEGVDDCGIERMNLTGEIVIGVHSEAAAHDTFAHLTGYPRVCECYCNSPGKGNS